MRARARLAATIDASTGVTRVTRLRSDPPLVLRPTIATGALPVPAWEPSGHAAAHVSLVAGAAGPLGGDHLRLEVDVGPGATLVLRTVAASLLLPGPRGLPSRTEISMRVAAGGTLVWLPEPVIATRRCEHRAVTRISLAAGARLLAREELILGRHGEHPGSVRQRTRVSVDGHTLHSQELAVGRLEPGWEGAAVTGGRRALGTVLVAGAADRAGTRPEPWPRSVDVAVLALAGDATLVTAAAEDSHALRSLLDHGLAVAVGRSDVVPLPIA